MHGVIYYQSNLWSWQLACMATCAWDSRPRAHALRSPTATTADPRSRRAEQPGHCSISHSKPPRANATLPPPSRLFRG